MSMTFATDVVVDSGNSIKTKKILAPTTSGGSTYGVGSNEQVLKSNGTDTYWGDASAVSLSYNSTTKKLEVSIN